MGASSSQSAEENPEGGDQLDTYEGGQGNDKALAHQPASSSPRKPRFFKAASGVPTREGQSSSSTAGGPDASPLLSYEEQVLGFSTLQRSHKGSQADQQPGEGSPQNDQDDLADLEDGPVTLLEAWEEADLEVRRAHAKNQWLVMSGAEASHDKWEPNEKAARFTAASNKVLAFHKDEFLKLMHFDLSVNLHIPQGTGLGDHREVGIAWDIDPDQAGPSHASRFIVCFSGKEQTSVRAEVVVPRLNAQEEGSLTQRASARSSLSSGRSLSAPPSSRMEALPGTCVKVETGRVHNFRVQVIDDIINCFIDGQQVQFERTPLRVPLPQTLEKGQETALPLAYTSGYVGVWAGHIEVLVNEMAVRDLQDIVHYNVRLHNVVRKSKAEEKEAHTKRANQFATEIRVLVKLQDFIRVKHNFASRRMKAYADEDQGKLREKHLLKWLALCTFFNKLDKVMKRPEPQGGPSIWDRALQSHLEMLDETAPPPPPPPLEKPPTKEEEKLHLDYEKRRNTYSKDWEEAGRKQLRKEHFQEVRDGHKFGKKEKDALAHRWFLEAQVVKSEEVYQDLIQKAYCLENDIADKIDPKELDDWVKKKLVKLQKEVEGKKPVAKASPS